MANLSRAVLTGLGVLVAVIVLSPVTVVAMVALVAPVGIVIGQRTRIEHEFVRGRSLPERLKSAYVWRLSGKEGASDSRAYALTGEMRRRVTTLQHEIIDMKRVARRKQARLVFLSNADGIVIVGMTIALLAWSYDRGHLSVPATVVLLTGVLRIQGIVGFAGFSVGLLHEGALFLHDVDEFVDDARSRSTGSERVIPAAKRQPVRSLRADDVSFRYRGADRDALNGVTVSLAQGRVVAIVGENGSGKTTLAKVLAGLFRPTGGMLLWDRGGGPTPVGDDDIADLRGSTSVVAQNVHETAWPVSAREHIAFGDLSRHDDNAVELAAETASAAAFIRDLPHGCETLLNPGFPNGTDLSGGQWQRLALARAFFRDAPFIVLDEPTAALDARAEHEIFETVRRLAKGRAVLLISHRFSTVRMADEIVVLDAGRVIEHGDHAALMAIAGGRYAEMYTLQATALLREEG